MSFNFNTTNFSNFRALRVEIDSNNTLGLDCSINGIKVVDQTILSLTKFDGGVFFSCNKKQDVAIKDVRLVGISPIQDFPLEDTLIFVNEPSPSGFNGGLNRGGGWHPTESDSVTLSLPAIGDGFWYPLNFKPINVHPVLVALAVIIFFESVIPRHRRSYQSIFSNLHISYHGICNLLLQHNFIINYFQITN